MRQYEVKVIHLFLGDDSIFFNSIVEMTVSNQDLFDVSQILFVTTSKVAYEKYHSLVNVELTKRKSTSYLIVRTYAKRCEKLVVHGFANPFQAIFLSNKLCSRVIWRSWGHDVFECQHSSLFKSIIKKIIVKSFSKKVDCFFAIAGNDFVDLFNLTCHFKNRHIFQLEYPIFFDNKKNNILTSASCKENKSLEILLGHSGFQNDNHIVILDKLKRFIKYDIHVNVVLSYGDKEYIESIIDYVNYSWPSNKITLITQKMEKEDYYFFLNAIDVAIFDGPKSYALGNIEALLFFEKTLFLNDNGIIARAFTNKGVPFMKTSCLDDISFNDLSKKINYSKDAKKTIKMKEYNEIIKSWELIYD